MDFSDLKDDKQIQEKINKFHASVEKIDKLLEVVLKTDIYDKLTTKEKVDYDLFLGYALNTLYWMYLRTRGQDPNTNDVKNQLNRIKQYMVKAKEAHERNTIRPKIDQGAAKRFIKHGLQYREEKGDDVQPPPNKKIKFADN